MSYENKKSRTVRLESSVDDRLVALCKHIGTNPNAYLIAEIGKAISRDEVSLRALDISAKSQADFFRQITEIASTQSHS